MGNLNQAIIRNMLAVSEFDQLLSALESGLVVIERDGTIAVFDNGGAVAWRGTAEQLRMIDIALVADPRVNDSAAERLALLRQVTTETSSSYRETLSRREQDVLGLICRGLTDYEMADRLGLSRNTVRNHIASLYRKLRINSRSAAVIWAYRRGFATNGTAAIVDGAN